MDVLANSLIPEEVDHSTITEDFFTDPDSVREIALKELEQHTELINDKGEFYPGIRVSLTDEVGNEIVDKITKHIKRKPIDFEASFHLTSGIHDCGLIHHDIKKYAGVIYLNPKPPSNCGTVIASLKDPSFKELVESADEQLTKEFSAANTTLDLDAIKSFIEVKEKYNQIFFKVDGIIKNVYNRMIIYKGGSTYHCPDRSFGDTREDSRLVVVFWFD